LFLLVFVTSLVALVTGQLNVTLDQFIKRWFEASWSTPWGIFTYTFVHKNLEHFALNMILLAVALVLFMVANLSLDDNERNRRTGLLTIAAFVVAALAALSFISLVPTATTLGASGLVYAILGMTFMFALQTSTNLAIGLVPLLKTRSWASKSIRPAVQQFAVSLGVFLILAIWVPVWGFQGAEEGVNVPGHILAFTGGVIVGAIYGLWSRKEGGENNPSRNPDGPD
jgi:membrane associated rhomboid family serine protease